MGSMHSNQQPLSSSRCAHIAGIAHRSLISLQLLAFCVEMHQSHHMLVLPCCCASQGYAAAGYQQQPAQQGYQQVRRDRELVSSAAVDTPRQQQ